MELLGKEKGLTLQEALNEGRKHGAAAMDTKQLQSLQSSVSSIDYVKKKKICGNCGLNTNTKIAQHIMTNAQGVVRWTIGRPLQKDEKSWGYPKAQARG